jgi:hypothetical protein
MWEFGIHLFGGVYVIVLWVQVVCFGCIMAFWFKDNKTKPKTGHVSLSLACV